MSKEKTLISEVVTGLGTIGRLSLEEGMNLDSPPKEIEGVDAQTWKALVDLYFAGAYLPQFHEAFAHGRYFLNSEQGLRGRQPVLVEWKGPHRPPEQDPVPCDLRIDHVFTISCKNLSKVLRNSSPTSLFRSALREPAPGIDWYHEVASQEYLKLYEKVLYTFNLKGFPKSPIELDRPQRNLLKKTLIDGWPGEVKNEVDDFTAAVSARSALELNAVLTRKSDKVNFYWKLMRLHSAPYFILGTQRSGPTRLRVHTPWDFQRCFALEDLEIYPEDVGQPQVAWRAVFSNISSGEETVTRGHFEIRWSHGKFCGAPEGKVYLDTPHHEAAGYELI